MPPDANRGSFIARSREIAKTIRDCVSSINSYFLVVSHHDADGLSGASILGATLAREKARFTIRIVEELREELLNEIAQAHPDVILFSDIGSGYLELLTSRAGEDSCRYGSSSP